MIHQHHATRLHFDLRLEMFNGKTPVLVSWAVPKNLPLRKAKPTLAIHVEDHPFEYGTFSGSIPKGNYGAGDVRIFDSGTYELLKQEPGKLTFRLHGERLRGIVDDVAPLDGQGERRVADLPEIGRSLLAGPKARARADARHARRRRVRRRRVGVRAEVGRRPDVRGVRRSDTADLA